MDESFIEAAGLTKTFGPITAISDVSFHVGKGELFGFIGPDGTGKTTLFRILTTLLLPDKGSARIGSHDVVKNFREIRKNIGYMAGRFSLYKDLTVEENLKFYATIFDTTIEENYHLIRNIYSHIEPFKKRLAGNLSGGMKQKLALSCALIHKPDTLVLDEPTTGVDAVSRREFWEMLKELKKEGITILVSTPYMDEASLCDRVALMQSGRIMEIDTPAAITSQYPYALFAVRAGNINLLLNDLEVYENRRSVQPFGQTVHFAPANAANEPEGLRKYLESRGHSGIRIEPIHAGIEDCFMMLMTNSEQPKTE